MTHLEYMWLLRESSVPATINSQVLALDISRLGVCKECDGRGDLFSAAEPTNAGQLLHSADCFERSRRVEELDIDYRVGHRFPDLGSLN